jgi:hypothetical protein
MEYQPMTAARPYQVCLYVGSQPPALDDVKVVDLTPASLDADAVLAPIKASGLTPADLRARVFFLADGDRDKALAVYAALLGFAGRRLDLSTGGGFVVAADFEASARRLPDAGRPSDPIDHLQLGAVTHPVIRSIAVADALTPDDVSAVRFARRLRFVPADNPIAALAQLIAVAAIRSRRDGTDRLPYLCAGDEPLAEDPAAIVGTCLDTLRRAGVELRRSLRSDDRGALVDRLDASPRQLRLLAGADLPIEATLVRLGAKDDPETGLWHCPRPGRHTNGDAHASMKVIKGKTQCFRCDSERVDSLRLTMDSLTLSADEAAAWLADDTKTVAPHTYGTAA